MSDKPGYWEGTKAQERREIFNKLLEGSTPIVSELRCGMYVLDGKPSEFRIITEKGNKKFVYTIRQIRHDKEGKPADLSVIEKTELTEEGYKKLLEEDSWMEDPFL